MACDDCERREQRTSPDRLDERLKRLETKTHIGDTFAIAVLVILASWAFLKLADKGVISLDG